MVKPPNNTSDHTPIKKKNSNHEDLCKKPHKAAPPFCAIKYMDKYCKPDDDMVTHSKQIGTPHHHKRVYNERKKRSQDTQILILEKAKPLGQSEPRATSSPSGMDGWMDGRWTRNSFFIEF
jgi:hypothetical protein